MIQKMPKRFENDGSNQAKIEEEEEEEEEKEKKKRRRRRRTHKLKGRDKKEKKKHDRLLWSQTTRRLLHCLLWRSRRVSE